jgi:hypothetical protein
MIRPDPDLSSRRTKRTSAPCPTATGRGRRADVGPSRTGPNRPSGRRNGPVRTESCRILRNLAESCAILRNLAQSRGILRNLAESCAILRDCFSLTTGRASSCSFAVRKRVRFSLRRRCLHPCLDPCLYPVVKQPRLAPGLRWVPWLRCSQPCWLGQRPARAQQWRLLGCSRPCWLGQRPARAQQWRLLGCLQLCWLGQRSALLHKAQQWHHGGAVRSHVWTLPSIRLSNSFMPARGSRAIHTHWRPTSFARANGAVGRAGCAATPGRAGDNVFSIFLPIPANPAQKRARKPVGWRRQHPPRARVGIQEKATPQRPLLPVWQCYDHKPMESPVNRTIVWCPRILYGAIIGPNRIDGVPRIRIAEYTSPLKRRPRRERRATR